MSDPVTIEQRGDVAVIRLDSPPVNALGHAVRAALVQALDAAAASGAAAIVLSGAGRAFSGGADIREFGKPPQPPLLTDVVERLDQCPKPVIAAIHGVALGGGFELALGCAYRVAGPGAQVGLPEVKLGLLPGAGGTQRLPRLVGPKAAIQLMTTGDPIPAAAARDLGIIDAVIEGDLLEGAVAFARAVAGKPVPRVRDRTDRIAGIDPALLAEARTEVSRRSRGLVSPLRIVDAVEAACTMPFEQGRQFERQLFVECLGTPQRAGLIHAFFAERAVAHVPGIPDATPTRPIGAAAVIGAGTMGGGIAMSLANAGIPVTLVEAEAGALDRGVQRIRETYASTVARGRMTQADLDQRTGLIRPTTDMARIAEADIVIEAVFERLDVKLDVFAKLDRLAKSGAILATNTSTLDVDRIAAATGRPQDVVGTHFFSPAQVMRLLEIVRGAASAPDAVATVMALSRKIKKVGVVVGVCDGFVGNRMLAPYFREAEFLLEEGASPAEVDQALVAFGMAMGPFQTSDMAGVDISWDIHKRRAAHRKPGERHSNLLDHLGEAGRFGQKTGLGWYRYEPGSRTPIPDPSLEPVFQREAERLGIRRRPIPAEEIVKRCLYGLVNEGAAILEEGIAARPGDIDVIWVTGYGFPAHRGGPMFWADQTGLPAVLADIKRFRSTQGEHWKPAPLLVRLADSGGRFADLAADRAKETRP